MKITDNEIKNRKQQRTGWVSEGNAEHENMITAFDSLKIAE
ncbi:hypothetical protein [[Clostridium] innocuum]|nr:hypothetical protein [[Clostridium] innocuum]